MNHEITLYGKGAKRIYQQVKKLINSQKYKHITSNLTLLDRR